VIARRRAGVLQVLPMDGRLLIRPFYSQAPLAVARSGVSTSGAADAVPPSKFPSGHLSSAEPPGMVPCAAKLDGFSEIPALEGTGCAFVVEAELEEAVASLKDVRQRNQRWRLVTAPQWNAPGRAGAHDGTPLPAMAKGSANSPRTAESFRDFFRDSSPPNPAFCPKMFGFCALPV
jgi:hypothetical protein